MRDDTPILGARITIRIFAEVAEQANVITQVAKDSEGGRRYDSISHFARCAFMKLLNEEKTRYNNRSKWEARQEAIAARRDRDKRSMAEYEGGFINETDEKPRQARKKKLLVRNRRRAI